MSTRRQVGKQAEKLASEIRRQTLAVAYYQDEYDKLLRSGRNGPDFQRDLSAAKLRFLGAFNRLRALNGAHTPPIRR